MLLVTPCVQIGGAFELLRPNVKDILYTLEVNTFKDGLLKGNDHAGCGFMLTRMAEGGNIKKGPVGVGVRLQETMRVGPFKVETVAAQVSELAIFLSFYHVPSCFCRCCWFTIYWA